jgi:hypothetical protein
MSESILKALMQLFAILAASKEGDQEATHAIVEGFLGHELRHDLVGGYMKLYRSLYEQLRIRNASGRKVMKVLSSSSTKVLVICDAINKELVQRQKIVLLVRMLEFLRNGTPDVNSQMQLDFVQAIARGFNVPEAEFTGLRDFVLQSSTLQIPESENLLIVDSDYGFHSDVVKHIYSENLGEQILFYKVVSVNMYLFTFVNGQEVSMNGTALNPARISRIDLGENPEDKIKVYMQSEEVKKGIGKDGVNIRLAGLLVGREIEVWREFHEDEDDGDDVLLSEFSNEIDQWIIDKLESIGCDTAKSVLALSPEDIAKRADLEDETVEEVRNILKAEFED